MKIKKQTIPLVVISCVGMGFLVASTFLYIQVGELGKELNAVAEQSSQTNARLESLASEVSRDRSLREVALSEISNRIEQRTAEIKKDASAEVRSAVNSLNRSIEENNSFLDLSSIITKWSPFVARVECIFEGKETSVDYLGSGFLQTSTKRPFAHLITNRHVVNLDGIKPRSCTVSLPGIKEKAKVESNAITILNAKSTTTDIAFVDIGNRVADIDARASLNTYAMCSTPARPGDRVVIIGYPNIGTKDDVTATEGIISGVEDKYYVTSAKLDAGNSGGAAILLQDKGNTCYLGIPTLVEMGRMESLGRILKASEIVE